MLWTIGGAALVAIVVGVAVSFIGRGAHGRVLPPPRARVYAAAQACLLTGPGGLAGPQVQPVWAGMQDASMKTRIRVSYLQVAGPATEAAALPYAASLIQQRCKVILGVGDVEVAALQQEARDQNSVRFVLIGGGTQAANVDVVPAEAPKDTRKAVSEMVEAAS
jgi:hypothetical protein